MQCFDILTQQHQHHTLSQSVPSELALESSAVRIWPVISLTLEESLDFSSTRCMLQNLTHSFEISNN